MISNKKPLIERYFDPLAKLLSGVDPNLLTLLGSIPPILFFVFLIYKMYLLALVAFLGIVFDFVDGMVAKKYNKVTDFGGFFDSLIDRIADFLFISAFAFSGIARWEIIAPLLLSSFLTSYIRSRAGLATNSHNEFAVGLIERPERLGCIALSLVTYMLFPKFYVAGFNASELILIVLTVLSFYTTLQRVIYAYKKL